MLSIIGKYGEIWYYGKDEYIGRSIHNYGEFSPAESLMIMSLGTGLCLDIGANIGCISQALEHVGINVVAFEPQPEIFKLLQKNIKGMCVNTALGNTTGTVSMPRIRYGDKGNYGGAACGTRSDLGSIDVPIVKLDSFNFENVGFIKIDVEGYELDVLKGGRGLITKCRPIMYVEDDRLEKRKALREYLNSIEYDIEEHITPLFSENNFFNNKKMIWDSAYVSHNLICRPRCSP